MRTGPSSFADDGGLEGLLSPAVKLPLLLPRWSIAKRVLRVKEDADDAGEVVPEPAVCPLNRSPTLTLILGVPSLGGVFVPPVPALLPPPTTLYLELSLPSPLGLPTLTGTGMVVLEPASSISVTRSRANLVCMALRSGTMPGRHEHKK